MQFLTLKQYIKYVFKYIYKKEFIWNSHHDEIINALTNVLKGKTNRLIINLPPRYAKSELVKLFISWATTYYPASQNIYTSYSANLAVSFTYSIRNILSTPHTLALNPNFALKDDAKAKGYFLTSEDGHTLGVGAGGSITGFGAGLMNSKKWGGCVVIDDPIKPTDAHSDTVRDNINEWFLNTLQSRTNNRNTPIILIMQRLNENDLSGFLIAGGSGEDWEHVCIPAITPDGNALWEFKHTLADLNRMRGADSYMFAGQYMQTPAPLGGGIVKQDWLQLTYDIPLIEQFDYFFITADTAQKANNWNDYSVLMFWGMWEDELYLLDMRRGKWESPQLHSESVVFFNRHNRGNFRNFWIEDKSSGIGLLQDLKAKGLPVAPLKADKDKITRTMNITRYLESKQVYIDKSIPDIDAVVHELITFPNGTHDDAHDTFVYGLTVAFVTGSPSFYIGSQGL